MSESKESRYFRLALQSQIGPGKLHNQTTLALTSGVARSMISDIYHGKRAAGRIVQEKLLQALNYSLADFLSLGRELDLKPSKRLNGASRDNEKKRVIIAEDIDDIRPAHLNAMGSVETLGLAACSDVHWQRVLTNENKITAAPVRLEGPAAFAMTVVGDSMVPAGILPGQVVYCDSNEIPAIGDAVFILLKDGFGTLKVFMGWSGLLPSDVRLTFVNRDNPKGEKWILLKGWDSPKDDDKCKVQNPYLITVGSTVVAQVAPVIFVRRKA